ncbi:hypothetical protein AYI70_g2809 [Smittium culicis]|uniref:Uncharacterized protein n=1 Tax=Smittium culicis TaxID=133412 RepID=A0A1R1Y6T1_9FUNG|nr:hypothetical protein AYI70_g2809 [Smittium culicis]
MIIFLKAAIIAASFAAANDLQEIYEHNHGLTDYGYDNYISLKSNHIETLDSKPDFDYTGKTQKSMENEIYDENDGNDDYNIFDQASTLNDGENVTNDEIGENFENQIFQDSAASPNTEVEIIDPSKLVNGNLNAESLKKMIEQLKSGESPSVQRSQIVPKISDPFSILDSAASSPPPQPKAIDVQESGANSEAKNPLESINMAAISSATRTMRMIPAWGEFNMPIPAPEYLRNTCDALTIKQVNSPLRLISRASKTGNALLMRQGLIESIKIIQSGENSVKNFFEIFIELFNKKEDFVIKKMSIGSNEIKDTHLLKKIQLFTMAFRGNEILIADFTKLLFIHLRFSKAARSTASQLVKILFDKYNKCGLSDRSQFYKPLFESILKLTKILEQKYQVNMAVFNNSEGEHIGESIDLAFNGNYFSTYKIITFVSNSVFKKINLFRNDVLCFVLSSHAYTKIYSAALRSIYNTIEGRPQNAVKLINFISNALDNNVISIKYFLSFYNLYFGLFRFSVGDTAIRFFTSFFAVVLMLFIPFCCCC